MCFSRVFQASHDHLSEQITTVYFTSYFVTSFITNPLEKGECMGSLT